ncbi:MAG: hypothetical protein K1X56_07590 [Flavobacteriales bacterium]|nr:hypothetical protein [Flavobacteriales bacterium]
MILIADSGSTKTAWRLVKADQKILQFNTPGIHPLLQDESQIRTTIQSLFSIAGFPDSNTIKSIFYYGTGCSSTERSQPVFQCLSTLFPAAVIEVESDMLGAARGLCGHREAIACILGTGSNSCHFNGLHILHARPSLGYILGDEGSGAWIGKNVLRAFLYGELPAHLAEKLKTEYALKKDEIIKKIYSEPLANRYMASFSPFVYRNSADPYMHRLVKEGFLAFFNKHISHYQIKNLSINATGSIAFFYADIFRDVCNELGFTLGTITESPIAGLTLYHLNEI